MADITPIQSDLSNGVRSIDTSNDPATSFASTLPASRPVDLITKQQIEDRQIGTLQYPADIPNYYMTFDIQSYARQDLFSVAQTTSLSYIVLPLPANLVDTQQTKYDQKPIGALQGAILNAGMGPVQQAVRSAGNGNITQAGKDLTNIFTGDNAKNIGASAGVGVVNSIDAAVPGVAAGIQAATGYAGNYFLTVLLDGPQYKTHNFKWQFSPRTPQESETLNRIIRVFNNAMAPGLAFGGAVFTFPRIFRIAYQPNPRYLYKFKPAVLMSFTVDYSGGGLPSFYRIDGTTNGKGAPVMLTIQASFLELEFWLRSDFGGDDNGSGGTLPDDPSQTTGPGRYD